MSALSAPETHLMLFAMSSYGGGFVSALACAWVRADESNQARLAAAFPDYVETYGPGSAFYQVVAKATAA